MLTQQLPLILGKAPLLNRSCLIVPVAQISNLNLRSLTDRDQANTFGEPCKCSYSVQWVLDTAALRGFIKVFRKSAEIRIPCTGSEIDDPIYVVQFCDWKHLALHLFPLISSVPHWHNRYFFPNIQNKIQHLRPMSRPPLQYQDIPDPFLR